MKKAMIAVTAIAMSASAFAQGTITFFNNNILNAQGQTYRAGIFQDNEPGNPGDGDLPGSPNFSTVGAGGTISIGLFLPGSTTPLNYTDGTPAVTTGRTGTAPEVFARTGDVVVTGAAPNSSVTLVVKAWTTSAGSYENALTTAGAQVGQASFVTKALGGTNPNPPPPSFFTPDMAPFTGFEMDTVPEPSTIALSVIGIGALLLRRRK
jgi:hypothetical protein